MNTTRVISELQEKYPGKKIVQNGKTEIVCEIEPGIAIAVIDKSAVHYHKITTETYTVIRGELTVFLNGKNKVLQTGDECRIDPWTIHWAEGNAAWVEINATPGWTPDDHIFVGKEEQINIIPYDPSWPETFEKEKKRIEQTLGSWIAGKRKNKTGVRNIKTGVGKKIQE